MDDRRDGAGGAPLGATRAEGLLRLGRFTPRMGRAYALDRNHDLGGADSATSRLSPYVRRRLVREAEVVHAAQERHGGAAEKFISEVLWRTYWKGWLEQRPSVWSAFCDAAAQPLEADVSARVAAAAAGQTGIACFDHWVRELRETGWLHNHARMWFASIWIFTLELPWERGAALFLSHLVDGDAASNTLSWRWVAGLQTRGKAYVARAENIARYTDGRFNPEGQLNEAPRPLEERGSAALVPLGPPDPLPGGEAALLLHGDDLHPESMPLQGVRILSVGGLAPEPGLSPVAAAWAGEALGDGLSRAEAHFKAPAEAVHDLLSWAEGLPVRTVVTPWAPQGRARDLLDAAAPGLERLGVRIVRVRRDWDERLWPLARKGFFPFREAAMGEALQISALEVSGEDLGHVEGPGKV